MITPPVCTRSPICSSDIVTKCPFSSLILAIDGKQPRPPDGGGGARVVVVVVVVVVTWNIKEQLLSIHQYYGLRTSLLAKLFFTNFAQVTGMAVCH